MSERIKPTTPPTDDELRQWKEAASAATPGPWSWPRHVRTEDVPLIEACRTALPRLIDEVVRLTLDYGSCRNDLFVAQGVATRREQERDAALADVERLKREGDLAAKRVKERFEERDAARAEVERLKTEWFELRKQAADREAELLKRALRGEEGRDRLRAALEVVSHAYHDASCAVYNPAVGHCACHVSVARDALCLVGG